MNAPASEVPACGPASGCTRIDPLRSDGPGRYADEKVAVVHARAGSAAAGVEVVRTPHFSVRREGHRVRVDHALAPSEVDNDLAGVLERELFAPGWLSGAEIFERVFTGLVVSTVDDPGRAWAEFYGNTLAGIERDVAGDGHSTIAGMAPVYRRAMELVEPGRVLDVGSCFGFLALLLSRRPGTEVVASDIAAGTIGLLRAHARRQGLRLGTLVCDGARVPLPDAAVDTVSVIHLLEHLEPEHGAAVVAEAVRLARRRVVLAVPFEREPNTAFGHVRAFDLDGLAELGRASGLPFQVAEHHGGWLMLDAA